MAWRGWSQHEAGRQLETSQTHISDLLKGKRNPGLSLAHAIERVTSAEHELAPGRVERWPEDPIRTEEWDEKAVALEQVPEKGAA